MEPSIIFGLVSALAGLALIIGHQRNSEKLRMLFGGICVAAALVAVSLIAERL